MFSILLIQLLLRFNVLNEVNLSRLRILSIFFGSVEDRISYLVLDG